ncbi:hypothetical protein J437_LFUL019137, partial [Ladona fulva]
MRKHRGNAVVESEDVIVEAETIAEHLGADFNMPRVINQQKHRANPPALTSGEFWRRSLIIPYIDSLIMSLEQHKTAVMRLHSLQVTLKWMYVLQSLIGRQKRKQPDESSSESDTGGEEKSKQNVGACTTALIPAPIAVLSASSGSPLPSVFGVQDQTWLMDYAPWLAYSKKLKGALCIYCVLFPPTKVHGVLGSFIVRPSNRYKDMHEFAKSHASSQWLKSATTAAKCFVENIPVDIQLISVHQQEIEANKEIVASIISTLETAFSCRDYHERWKEVNYHLLIFQNGNAIPFLCLVDFARVIASRGPSPRDIFRRATL